MFIKKICLFLCFLSVPIFADGFEIIKESKNHCIYAYLPNYDMFYHTFHSWEFCSLNKNKLFSVYGNFYSLGGLIVDETLHFAIIDKNTLECDTLFSVKVPKSAFRYKYWSDDTLNMVFSKQSYGSCIGEYHGLCFVKVLVNDDGITPIPNENGDTANPYVTTFPSIIDRKDTSDYTTIGFFIFDTTTKSIVMLCQNNYVSIYGNIDSIMSIKVNYNKDTIFFDTLYRYYPSDLLVGFTNYHSFDHFELGTPSYYTLDDGNVFTMIAVNGYNGSKHDRAGFLFLIFNKNGEMISKNHIYTYINNSKYIQKDYIIKNDTVWLLLQRYTGQFTGAAIYPNYYLYKYTLDGEFISSKEFAGLNTPILKQFQYDEITFRKTYINEKNELFLAGSLQKISTNEKPYIAKYGSNFTLLSEKSWDWREKDWNYSVYNMFTENDTIYLQSYMRKHSGADSVFLYVGKLYDGTTSIHEEPTTQTNNITIYPNPTSNYLDVSLAEVCSKITAEVLDLEGKALFKMDFENEKDFRINFPFSLPDGTYTLSLTTDGKQTATSFVIAK